MHKVYSDFIGNTISVQITPFEYSSDRRALEIELWRRIKSELSHTNGLCCDFTDINVIIHDTITVYGTVIQCEVDC